LIPINIGAAERIVHHTRLPDVKQVVACLDILNQAFSNACGDVTARFCALEGERHFFIAMETQQNIQRLWDKVVARQQPSREEDPEAAPEPVGRDGEPLQAAAGNERRCLSPRRRDATIAIVP
jgi:hypothetical protein